MSKDASDDQPLATIWFAPKTTDVDQELNAAYYTGRTYGTLDQPY